MNEIEKSSTKGIVGANDHGAAQQPAAMDRIRKIEEAYRGEIAVHGHEAFIRHSDGSWMPASGTMKRELLTAFGTDPDRNGLWGAFCLYFAVDPNNDGAYTYYQRKKTDKGWKYWDPIEDAPNRVYFGKGHYDLVTKEFTPFPEDTIPFGPMVETMPRAEVLEACRADDFTKAPAKAAGILGMVDYALADSNGKTDRETAAYFRGICAQVLRPHSGWTQFVSVRGESGARKTTILRALLSAPLGSRGVSEISEALLAERIFMRPGLVNRIANLSNDSAQSEKFSTFIKEVTSGVLIVEKKFRDAAKVKLSAKLFSTMNTPQDLSDDSLGIENRLITFEFRGRPPEDNNRGATGTQWMDPAFYSEEDREWLVAWMLTGLERQWAKGYEELPVPPARVLAWKERMLNEAMPLRAFAAETLEFGPKLEVEKDKVYDAAVEAGVMAPGHRGDQTRIGEFLAARYGVRNAQRMHDGKRFRVFTGCRLLA